MKIEDVIKKLEQLDEGTHRIEFEIKPEVNCIENFDGTGWETIQYIYYITIIGDEIVKRYKKIGDFKEYIKENK